MCERVEGDKDQKKKKKALKFKNVPFLSRAKHNPDEEKQTASLAYIHYKINL